MGEIHNLLVPEPRMGSLAELNALLRDGCDRVNAASLARDGRPVAEAGREDLAAMLALPAAPFDAVRWERVRSDSRGYVEVCGPRYCAGPAWHDRWLIAGVRPSRVEILAERGRRVADLPKSWAPGEVVRNPLSLVPALVARPRAFGESTIRRDMPPALVEAVDRMDAAGRRRALRAIVSCIFNSDTPFLGRHCLQPPNTLEESEHGKVHGRVQARGR